MASSEPPDPVSQSLIRVHAALRRSLETIIRISAQPIPESDRADFVEFCARFTHFLRVHHEGEEEILFPKLTQAAQTSSLPDVVSAVTGWLEDHEKLLVHLSEFEAACTRFGNGDPQEALHRTAKEVRDVLVPHLDAEEAPLDGGAIAKLLQADEIVALGVALAKHGQRVGGPKALMLLVHGLTGEEQTAHFAKVPWFVRKLLVKHVWARSFRGCLKYAHNSSIAL